MTDSAHHSGRTSAITHLWHDELGWGVVESAQTPGGCWVHFSHLEMPGYRILEPGQRVQLTWQTPGEGSYAFRAVRVVPDDAADGTTTTP